jgi:hypothetical protein
VREEDAGGREADAPSDLKMPLENGRADERVSRGQASERGVCVCEAKGELRPPLPAAVAAGRPPAGSGGRRSPFSTDTASHTRRPRRPAAEDGVPPSLQIPPLSHTHTPSSSSWPSGQKKVFRAPPCRRFFFSLRKESWSSLLTAESRELGLEANRAGAATDRSTRRRWQRCLGQAAPGGGWNRARLPSSGACEHTP